MSLELNKIAASVLTAGVVAMGAGFIADLLIHPRAPDEPAYAVAPREAPDDPDAAPVGPEPIIGMIADADIAAGENARRACAACHTFDEGGDHGVGPNLWGVMGDEIAGRDGFNYSDALLEKAEEEGTWDYQNMNAFLEDPGGWAPGTRMAYGGMANTEDRANLIAYMREQDDDPIDLPSEEEIEAVMAEWEGEEEPAEDEVAEENGLAARLQQADASAGESAVRACAACHTFDEGGANRVGPNLYDMVGAEIASVDGFGNYSSTLQEMDEVWTYENLDGFLENPREWAPGTTMSFAGVGDPQDRANIIAYMREMSEDPPALPTADGAEEADDAEEAEEDEEADAGGKNGNADGHAANSGANGATDAAAQPVSANDVLAGADLAAGQRVARSCVACHTFEEGGANRVGPNLHAMLGGPVAANSTFNYSEVLKEAGGEWTFERLDAFLEDPRGWAPGTRMTFPGVRQAEDRKNLIAFMQAQ